MIVSMFLVPLLFVILTVVAVGNPAATPPGNWLVDSMTEEPEVLSPEVVGKVDQNWLRDVKAATAKQYVLEYKKFQASISSDCFFKTQIRVNLIEYMYI